jgi:hypothetical protein
MALVAVNVGVQEILRRALNYSATGDVKLHLFQSNTTPAETDTTATYTEATWTGYAAITLTGASWTVTNADPASASYAEQTFTSTAGSQSQANYGYYVTNSASTVLLWAERFSDGPYTIVNNGDVIKVTPVITLD